MRMNTRSNRIEASTASPIPGIAATSVVGFGDGRDGRDSLSWPRRDGLKWLHLDEGSASL